MGTMMNSKLIFLFFLISCSNINTESQTHYKEQKKKSHHGIITLEESIEENDVASINRGEILYKKNCVGCHGNKGEGNGTNAQFLNTPPKNLNVLLHDYPNFKFYLDSSQASGNMPGWNLKHFSDQELKDLTRYLKKLTREKNI